MRVCYYVFLILVMSLFSRDYITTEIDYVIEVSTMFYLTYMCTVFTQPLVFRWLNINTCFLFTLQGLLLSYILYMHILFTYMHVI